METCKVFVGAVPYDAELDALEEDFARWGSVVRVEYPGPKSGWATVEFSSVKKRDEFLKEKHRHRVLNKVVDVKIWYPKKNKSLRVPPGSSDNRFSTLAAPQNANNNNNGCKNKFSRSPAVDGQLTAVVTGYFFEQFGLLRTDGNGNGFFHFDSLYFCSLHRLACQEATCQDLARFSDRFPGRRLRDLLPVGTHVALLTAPINTPQYAFQASLVWPRLSKRPLHAVQLSREELLQRLDLLIRSPASSSSRDGSDKGGNRSLEVSDHDKESVTSSSRVVVGSCGDVKRGADAAKFDLGNYIDAIDKLRGFFVDQFKFDGRDPKELEIGNLAYSIMNLFGRGNKDNTEIKSVCLIYNFIKDNDINASKVKISNILSHFKVLHHSIAYQTRNISSAHSHEMHLLRLLSQMKRSNSEFGSADGNLTKHRRSENLVVYGSEDTSFEKEIDSLVAKEAAAEGEGHDPKCSTPAEDLSELFQSDDNNEVEQESGGFACPKKDTGNNNVSVDLETSSISVQDLQRRVLELETWRSAQLEKGWRQVQDLSDCLNMMRNSRI